MVAPVGSGCRDTVQVWKIKLGFSHWQSYLAELPAEERERAWRFVFDRDRRRFVVARAALRRLVGFHVGTPPRRIRLSVQPRGKPYLADGDAPIVHFNVSHSEDLALIALSQRDVGIDVEQIRPLAGLTGIAMRHFAPEERRAFLRAAPVERLTLFYRYWTLKEAYLKAKGVGMHTRLDTVDVSAVAEHPVVVQAGWSARTLPCGPGYAAALVVQGRAGYAVSMMDFTFGDPGLSARLTSTDTPHTVKTSISANG
jgi:4'-phosphopantetheinyl transferase